MIAEDSELIREVLKDALLENKVTKKVLAAGAGYDNPRKGWEADVLYVATQDGAHESAPQRVVIGGDQLPAGLERALVTMRVGEKAEVRVAADVEGK